MVRQLARPYVTNILLLYYRIYFILGVFAFPRKRKAVGKPSPSKLKKSKRGRKAAASPARSAATTGAKSDTGTSREGGDNGLFIKLVPKVL